MAPTEKKSDDVQIRHFELPVGLVKDCAIWLWLCYALPHDGERK